MEEEAAPGPAPFAGEPGAGALARLPACLVYCILAKCDPRSLKLAGGACRALRWVACQRLGSLEYGRWLAAAALPRLEASIRRECFEAGLTGEVEFAREAAPELVEVLAGTRQPPAEWGPDQVRVFLEMVATRHVRRWRLGPYALEWCWRAGSKI